MEMKMPIASLLAGNPMLWHDLSNWMNGQLNSMVRVLDETSENENVEFEEPQEIPPMPINKLGQYFGSDDPTPISYHHKKVEAILEKVNIMTMQCWEQWKDHPWKGLHKG